MRPSRFKEYDDRNRERQKGKTRSYNARVRAIIIELLGGECVRCHFTDPRALQVDHVNGGGSKERKSTTRGFYHVVLENHLSKKTKYQLLCANCNWIKRFENNETALNSST